jgi:hypothetical protein
MSKTVTVRITEEQARWLAETSRRTGQPVSGVLREQLEKARTEPESRPFLRHIGSMSGPPDLSSRKGFSRS